MTATATRKKSKGSGSGFTIPYGELKRALGIVAPAVAARGVKPVLANVLLSDGTMTATDLEMRIETPIAWSGSPVLLPHDRLTQIVNVAGSVEEVEIKVDGSKANVRAGNGEWTLPTEDPQEYPARADAKAKSIAGLPADQFRHMASTVRGATDAESSRYALGAVLVEWSKDEGKLFLVATDGRRLAIAEAEPEVDTDSSQTLAPRRAVDTLIKLSGGAQHVQLETTGSEFVATVDDTRLYARIVEGRFPRWRDVDVTHDTVPSRVVVGSLLHSCSMAAVCTSDDSKGTTWAFTDAGLWISGQSSLYGESSATCDLAEAGHTATVKLDPRYVSEWLRTLDAAETIDVLVKDKDSAVILRAETCRQIVMPMTDE